VVLLGRPTLRPAQPSPSQTTTPASVAQKTLSPQTAKPTTWSEGRPTLSVSQSPPLRRPTPPIAPSPGWVPNQSAPACSHRRRDVPPRQTARIEALFAQIAHLAIALRHEAAVPLPTAREPMIRQGGASPMKRIASPTICDEVSTVSVNQSPERGS